MDTPATAPDVETCRHCDTSVNLPRASVGGRVVSRRCQCGETIQIVETVRDAIRANASTPRRDENGESAPEHLRNALHLLRHTGHETLAGWGYELDDLEAIRRRIASALKLLEG